MTFKIHILNENPLLFFCGNCVNDFDYCRTVNQGKTVDNEGILYTADINFSYSAFSIKKIN